MHKAQRTISRFASVWKKIKAFRCAFVEQKYSTANKNGTEYLKAVWYCHTLRKREKRCGVYVKFSQITSEPCKNHERSSNKPPKEKTEPFKHNLLTHDKQKPFIGKAIHQGLPHHSREIFSYCQLSWHVLWESDKEKSTSHWVKLWLVEYTSLCRSSFIQSWTVLKMTAYWRRLCVMRIVTVLSDRTRSHPTDFLLQSKGSTS